MKLRALQVENYLTKCQILFMQFDSFDCSHTQSHLCKHITTLRTFSIFCLLNFDEIPQLLSKVFMSNFCHLVCCVFELSCLRTQSYLVWGHYDLCLLNKYTRSDIHTHIHKCIILKRFFWKLFCTYMYIKISSKVFTFYILQTQKK